MGRPKQTSSVNGDKNNRDAKVGIWSHYLHSAASTLAWMSCSSAIIIVNKELYRTSLAYPFYITGCGQIASALGGLVLAWTGVLKLRSPPNTQFFLTKLLPIIASTAATMFFGNLAYLMLSVSFIQILKAFTPALTLLLCVLAGLEKSVGRLSFSVALITGGTAIAAYVESEGPSFHMGGFLTFMLSALAEAVRVVGTEVLLGKEKFNMAEALVYISGPAGALLVLGAVFMEAPHGLIENASTQPVLQGVSYALSFLVNLTFYYAVKTTSSLSLKIAGCMKNLVVVWYSMLAHGELVTLPQVLGYFVSVAGFAVYSHLKMTHQPPPSGGKHKVKNL